MIRRIRPIDTFPSCNLVTYLYTLLAMKKGIHPDMHATAKTTCSTCGAVFAIPSTVQEQTVEVCRMCHPVYTGKETKTRTGGRIDRFRKRMAAGKTA